MSRPAWPILGFSSPRQSSLRRHARLRSCRLRWPCWESANAAPSSDLCARLNVGKRTNFSRLINHGSRRNERCRMDAWVRWSDWMKQRGNSCPAFTRRCRDDEDRRGRHAVHHIGMHDHCTRTRFLQGLGVASVVQKADLVWPRCLKRCNSGQHAFGFGRGSIRGGDLGNIVWPAPSIEARLTDATVIHLVIFNAMHASRRKPRLRHKRVFAGDTRQALRGRSAKLRSRLSSQLQSDLARVPAVVTPGQVPRSICAMNPSLPCRNTDRGYRRLNRHPGSSAALTCSRSQSSELVLANRADSCSN